jgi:hypothetical protein
VKTTSKKLEGNDRLYGWEFGCDGWMNASEAARELSLSVGYFCELLRELEETAVKRPTDRTWPLRAGRPEVAQSRREWSVCKRSVAEYAIRRKPIEV